MKTQKLHTACSKLLAAIAMVIATTTLLTSVLSHAQGYTPTAAQIEQFKRMPPAQQQALAQSMGINLDDILGSLENANVPQQETTPISGNRNAPNPDQSDVELNAREAVDTLSLEEDKETDALHEKLELFGYDIFQFGADTFSPATDIPIPADYVMGPGDSLTIQLYGKENSTHNLVLNRDGQVMFPNIGPVTLAGMSFSHVSQKIDDVVSQQMIGVKSSVSMGSLRTIRVFVMGDVNVAGSYVVGSLSTMTNAIFASGGITKIGSLRNIQLKRRGKIITTLDLYDLLLSGDTSKDARLLPGDVIFVPPIGKTVGVAGEVKRPAIYELQNEKTVAQALELAGGLMPTAFVPASRIERILKNSGEKTLVNIDLSTAKGNRFKIQDADVIQIFSTLDTMRDIVKLDGHVKRPGGFAWRSDMRFTDIVTDVDDLLSNPDIDIAIIQREQKDTRKIVVHTFSPRLAFATPNSVHNPKLESRDTITLFDYESDRSELLFDLLARLSTQSNINERTQIVKVTGSVRFPGDFPLSDEMTVNDAIYLAGGLTENAMGSAGEITRYSMNEARESVAMHIELNMQLDNPLLSAGDTLTLKQIPLWQDKELVELTGEVLHPGTYSILPGETLMDVLYRAGGLTPHAYAPGAIFSRLELRKLEQERLQDLKEVIEADIAAANIQDSALRDDKGSDEAAQILNNIEGTEAVGRMVIDLPAILVKPEAYDFQLEDGDRLDIPRYKPSVMVVGEVQFPTSHFFDNKLSVKDYIGRSGGTNQNADNKRIYVVKANGSVFLPSRSAWFRSKGEPLHPGDTIVVPIDTDRVDKLTVWTSVTQILYQSAIAIAAVQGLGL